MYPAVPAACPRVRRTPKGVAVLNSWWSTAYPGGPIVDYYRVPCGFKLSRHIRVRQNFALLFRQDPLQPSVGSLLYPAAFSVYRFPRDNDRSRTTLPAYPSYRTRIRRDIISVRVLIPS